MKLIKNSEVEKCLNNIILNVTKYLESTTKQYNYKKAKLDIVNQLLGEYEELGVKREIKFDTELFYSIPYNRDIKFDSVRSNGIVSLEKFKIKKNILHMFDYPITDKYLKTYVPFGAYTKDIDTFKVTENGHIYMTPTIMEYNTMKEEINRAKGNVLTFGLGIGFFQYMCLLKDDVKKVVVIEQNETIIKFFKENILPQFKRKDIEIIKGNAFDYFNQNYFDLYDYIFVDIHFNNDDGSEVYKSLIESNVDMSNVGFWIENQILFETKMCVASYLYNYVKGTLSDMLLLENNLRDKFKSIHRTFKDEEVVIDSEEMILKYINDKEFLRRVIIQS